LLNLNLWQAGTGFAYIHPAARFSGICAGITAAGYAGGNPEYRKADKEEIASRRQSLIWHIAIQ
jgi:hypothetical protein